MPLQLPGRAVLLIAPAALARGAVPNQHLRLAKTLPRRVTPGQHFLVSAACQNAMTQGGIFHTQEPATPGLPVRQDCLICTLEGGPGDVREIGGARKAHGLPDSFTKRISFQDYAEQL